MAKLSQFMTAGGVTTATAAQVMKLQDDGKINVSGSALQGSRVPAGLPVGDYTAVCTSESLRLVKSSKWDEGLDVRVYAMMRVTTQVTGEGGKKESKTFDVQVKVPSSHLHLIAVGQSFNIIIGQIENNVFAGIASDPEVLELTDDANQQAPQQQAPFDAIQYARQTYATEWAAADSATKRQVKEATTAAEVDNILL